MLTAVEPLVSFGQQRYESMVDQALEPEEKFKAFIDARLSLGIGENIDALKAWVSIGSEAVRQEEVKEIYSKAIEE